MIKNHAMSQDDIEGSINPDSPLQEGTIIVYKTKENRWGKFQIVYYQNDGKGNDLKIKFVTFESNGDTAAHNDELLIRGTYLCDLDKGKEVSNASESDFF